MKGNCAAIGNSTPISTPQGEMAMVSLWGGNNCMGSAMLPFATMKRRKANCTAMKRKRTVALRKQKGLCYYCRKPLRKSRATAEHLIARSKGGKDSKKNIVAACMPCNKAKGCLPLEVFLQNHLLTHATI